jgi:FtsP/CotA-like multicopper oxidase with cupredoxin domain
LAFVVIAWQQMMHAVLYGHHSDGTGLVLGHWLRDGALALPAAALAVWLGLRLARRWGRSETETRIMLSRTAAVAGVFAVVLVPLVGVHSALDRFLGGEGALGPIVPAPGAGYLTAEGFGTLENATGVWGLLVHGARDSLMGLAASIPLLFLAQLLLSRPATTPETRRRSLLVPQQRSFQVPTGLTRREVIKYGGAGTAALAASSAAVLAVPAERAAAEPGTATPWLTDDIELVMNDGIVDMIDGTPVYMLGYGFASGGMDKRDELHTPGPVIWATEGAPLKLRIVNELDDVHSFLIRRENDIIVDSGPLEPGDSVDLEFAAPSAGTYLYQDGVNMPVNRVLGLQGALLSMPADGSRTPHPDLETWQFDTQWVWQFNEIDPAFNAKAQAGRTIDVADFENNFKPRYFTINGRMGSLAAHIETAPDTVIEDKVGHPALVRVVNGGLAVHGPHIHGNHVWVLMRNARVHDTIMWKDTIMVEPEVTTDFLLPFTVPPNAVHWPPHPDGVAFLRELHGKDIEGSWPMHCHIEMSQSAGGGLYPQGLLTDWKLKP